MHCLGVLPEQARVWRSQIEVDNPEVPRVAERIPHHGFLVGHRYTHPGRSDNRWRRTNWMPEEARQSSVSEFVGKRDPMSVPVHRATGGTIAGSTLPTILGRH